MTLSRRLQLALTGFLMTIGGALSGKDIYVAQVAQSGDTGADAANAHSAAWFSTSANWGAGSAQISPGDTVHLTGVFSSALAVQASGTEGNPITLLFESNARLSSPAWPVTGAINVGQHDYI